MLFKRLAAAVCLLGLLANGGHAIAATPAGQAVPAPPEPTYLVAGYYVQPSVDLLRRFAMIAGDPDGRLRLADPITRAELAKIVVVALGQGEAARKAQDEPLSFPDLKGHWARGYVAVARRMNIVSGYADGTFRPGSQVTHAEALTMLLRTGGLRPAGPWPQAYFDGARAAGVLTDPLLKALPPANLATRGAVFLLAERSFTLLADGTGRTLLQRVFGFTPPKVSVNAGGVQSGLTNAPEVTLAVTAPGAILVQVNGAPAWPVGSRFQRKVPLTMGPNEIFVLAVDELGNAGFQRLLIERR